jgi:DNA-binding SARP family transcriptional activator/tetratricopeptide (TPR) repeat protein
MDFAVLGPLEVRTPGGRVSLGGERQQRLLAALLLKAGRSVAVDSLVDTLWDGDPPATARRQIHNGVWQLRRALAGTGATLHNEAPGYRLGIDVNRFDLRRFEHGLAEGRRRAASGDLSGAARTFRAALTLWRGPALAGIGGGALEREAARLNELRLAALEDCVEHELACGAGHELIAELAALVAEYPIRERLVAALMLALYRGGRQAEALTAYREVATQLRDELGVDPGPLLRQRFDEVLRSADVPARRRCLPSKPDVLAGRADVIARILAPDRPATFVISGMAGVGKTALAVHVAYELGAEYPDAHLFLDLQGHSEQVPVNPADALGALLSQLGVPSNHVPEDLAGRTSLWRTELADRRAIVVLDNASGSAQIAPLLPGRSTTLVLVTSRSTLGPLDGARQMSLDLLEPDAAVGLLRYAVADRVDADPKAAAEVAALCGRLPLALRLAAHRLHDRPMWSMAALADRLRAADPPPVDVAVEGRSAATAFSMSYRLLTEPLQRLFRLLGIHPSGAFQAHAAAALADLPVATTRAMLDELVDVHLVRADTPGRYRLHDLLRDFAGSLVGEQEYEDALTRMLDYYLHTTAAATAFTEQTLLRRSFDFGSSKHLQQFGGPAEALNWLGQETSTVTALVDVACRRRRYRHACLLPRAIWHHMFNQGQTLLALRLHKQATLAARELDDASLVAVTNASTAALEMRLGHVSDALVCIDEAMRLFESVGDQQSRLAMLLNASSINCVAGRFAQAVEQAEESTRLRFEVDGGDFEHHNTNRLAVAYRCIGRPQEALVLHREALKWVYQHQRWFRYGILLGEVACDHLRLGHVRVSVLLLRRALKIKEATGNECGYAETLSDLGTALVADGSVASALELQREALQRIRRLQDRVAVATVSNDIGYTFSALGRFDDAVMHHRAALEASEKFGWRYQLARAHAGIAAATAHRDVALAREHWQRAFDLFSDMGTPEAAEVAQRLADVAAAGTT